VRELVEHQHDFLDHGVKHLKPLKMQEIADRLGIHVSTVSRTIAEKYIQSHRGIFPLKYFFTGGTRSSDGSVESRVGVRQKVKEIIVAKLGVDANQITPEASFTNDLGADSLDTVELVMEFEKAFNIQIPDEDAEKIGTVGDVINYLKEKGVE